MTSKIYMLFILFALGLPHVYARGLKLNDAEKDFLRIVDLLITPNERRTFNRQLSTHAERAAFMDLFWAKRDPDLTDNVNPFKDVWLARMDYIVANFERTDERLPQSDKSIIYLLFGEPTRIEYRIDRLLMGQSYRNRYFQHPPELWVYIDHPYFRQNIVKIQMIAVNAFGDYKAFSNNFISVLVRRIKYEFIQHPDLERAPLSAESSNDYSGAALDTNQIEASPFADNEENASTPEASPPSSPPAAESAAEPQAETSSPESPSQPVSQEPAPQSGSASALDPAPDPVASSASASEPAADSESTTPPAPQNPQAQKSQAPEPSQPHVSDKSSGKAHPQVLPERGAAPATPTPREETQLSQAQADENTASTAKTTVAEEPVEPEAEAEAEPAPEPAPKPQAQATPQQKPVKKPPLATAKPPAPTATASSEPAKAGEAGADASSTPESRAGASPKSGSESEASPAVDPMKPLPKPVLAEAKRPVASNLAVPSTVSRRSAAPVAFNTDLANNLGLAAESATFRSGGAQALWIGRVGFPLKSLSFNVVANAHSAPFILTYALVNSKQETFLSDQIQNEIRMPSRRTIEKEGADFSKELSLLLPSDRYTLQMEMMDVNSGKRAYYEKTFDVRPMAATGPAVSDMNLLDPNVDPALAKFKIGETPYGLLLQRTFRAGDTIYPILEVSNPESVVALEDTYLEVYKNDQLAREWILMPEELTETVHSSVLIHPELTLFHLEPGDYTLRFEYETQDGKLLIAQTKFKVIP